MLNKIAQDLNNIDIKVISDLGNIKDKTINTLFVRFKIDKVKAIKTTYYSLPNKHLIIINLQPTISMIRESIFKIIKYIKDLKIEQLVLADLSELRNIEVPPCRIIIEELFSNLYDFYKYKTDYKSKLNLKDIYLYFSKPAECKNVEVNINKGKIVAEAVNLAKDILHEPANIIDPVTFAELSSSLVSSTNVSIKVLDKNDILKLGMGGVLAVSKGSSIDPRIVILEYKGGGDQTIGLVGKGVTFDSGGLDLKSEASIHRMKVDKAGAVAVLTSILACAKLELPVNLIGVLPLAENMPDGHATHPGDIIKTMSGKTVEVVNTDAEGRILLAEANTYILQNYKLDCLINLSTISKDLVILFGRGSAALFSNNNNLAGQLDRVGDLSKDRVCRLPLLYEFKSKITSSIADLRNFAGKEGSPILANLFIESFVSDIPWAHIDMSPVILRDFDEFMQREPFTGFGTKLLTYFIEHF